MQAKNREHWSAVYETKLPTEVSWYQHSPEQSLLMIDKALNGLHCELDSKRHIIDVGGGASTLVDCLLKKSNVEICVVDIARCALNLAMERLNDQAGNVHWVAADVSEPIAKVHDEWADVWHDRAVFHFLTTPEARLGYAQNFTRILRPGGTAVIATFAPNGPRQCSGLDVCRHDGSSILTELLAAGADLTLEKEVYEEHKTPWGSVQSFVYALIRRT